jgi:hypothetical protein
MSEADKPHEGEGTRRRDRTLRKYWRVQTEGVQAGNARSTQTGLAFRRRAR